MKYKVGSFRPEELLIQARMFERNRPHRKSAVKEEWADVEILTPEDLMIRLKVTRGWINEKRRPRCAHPLPAVTSRPLRFNWYAVIIWLQEEAKLDAERLKHKRVSPVRHSKHKVA